MWCCRVYEGRSRDRWYLRKKEEEVMYKPILVMRSRDRWYLKKKEEGRNYV